MRTSYYPKWQKFHSESKGAEVYFPKRIHIFDEVEKGGITKSDGLKIAKILSDSGLIDYLNINRGRIHTDPILTKHIPIQGMKSAPHLEFAGEIKKEVNLPIFHASKISDVATARYAISNGLVDMIGMTRGHLADPHIVKKIKGNGGQSKLC